MRRSLILLVAVLVSSSVLVACADDESSKSNDSTQEDEVPITLGSPTVPGAPEFGVASILIDGAEEGPILLEGEVADTDETRSFGLMGRTEIPDRYGMAFIYFEDRDCCFYMKDTLIPLSIAFFDVEGKIVDIVEMEPCKEEPCKLYGSDEPYRGALEVNQGLFEEWGVSEGDRIRIVQ